MPWKVQIKNIKLDGEYNRNKTINLRYRNLGNTAWNALPNLIINKRGNVINHLTYFISGLPDNINAIELNVKDDCGIFEYIETIYK